MTTKQVLKIACALLDKKELLESNYFEEDGQELTAENLEELNHLAFCLSLVIKDIAADYLYIIKQKELTFDQFKFPIDQIDEQIHQIISLKNVKGNNIPYKIINNNLIAKCNKAIIEYKIVPDNVDLYGNCECFCGRITDVVMAYGVCTEHCSITEQFDDLNIWEARYKNSLIASVRKKSEMKLPKRRWI